jgi:hypothetical protein
MNNVIIRHKVEDFNKWKPVYDGNLSARQAAGLKDIRLWRNLNDPDEIVMLFEVADITKAKKFSESTELKEKMQEAGVLGPPDFIFLSDK